MRKKPVQNWDWDSVPLPTDKGKTRENLSYAQAARKPTNPPTTNKKPTLPPAKSSQRPWNFNNVQQHQTQSPPSIFNLNSNKDSTFDTRLTKLEHLFGDLAKRVQFLSERVL